MAKTAVNAPQVKNMTAGPSWRCILPFALPLMLGSAFQQVYALTDTAVVGRVLGVTGLAALGACDLLTWIMGASLQAYTEGFSIRMANCFGAGDRPRLHRTMATAALLTASAALLLTVLLQLAAPWLLRVMDVQPEIYPMALTYLRIIYAGLPFVATYQYFFAILRALGNSQTPLRTMMLSSVVNIALDLLFVAVFHWGIGGAAIATILAQALAAAYSFFHARKLLPDGSLLYLADAALAPSMLGLSLPMSGQIIISSVGGLVVQAVVNRYSVAFIAGYTATYKLYGLVEMAAIAYGHAVTTYTSQNLGARELGRIRQGIGSAVKIALATAVLIAAAMIGFGQPLVGLFISGAEQERAAAVQVGYRFLCVMSVGLPLLYTMHIAKACLQGLGRAVFATVNSFLELTARILVVLYLPAHFGAASVFLAEPAAWLVGTTVLVCSAWHTLGHLAADHSPAQ